MANYIDLPLLRSLQVADAVPTGFGGNIVNDLYYVETIGTASATACGPGTWVALVVIGLRAFQADAVNVLIDRGESEMSVEDGRAGGRLIFNAFGGIDGELQPGEILYLATPYMLDD